MEYNVLLISQKGIKGHIPLNNSLHFILARKVQRNPPCIETRGGALGNSWSKAIDHSFLPTQYNVAF
jgi:hypothetical protein